MGKGGVLLSALPVDCFTPSCASLTPFYILLFQTCPAAQSKHQPLLSSAPSEQLVWNPGVSGEQGCSWEQLSCISSDTSDSRGLPVPWKCQFLSVSCKDNQDNELWGAGEDGTHLLTHSSVWTDKTRAIISTFKHARLWRQIWRELSKRSC